MLSQLTQNLVKLVQVLSAAHWVLCPASINASTVAELLSDTSLSHISGAPHNPEANLSNIFPLRVITPAPNRVSFRPAGTTTDFGWNGSSTFGVKKTNLWLSPGASGG